MKTEQRRYAYGYRPTRLTGRRRGRSRS